jgi:hypothetical protein
MTLIYLWEHHGTKIMGWLVAVLGALTAFADRFKELFWTDRGDLIFQLIVDIASYLLIGAGAVIIRRGYTNKRRAGETPFRPGETQETP